MKSWRCAKSFYRTAQKKKKRAGVVICREKYLAGKGMVVKRHGRGAGSAGQAFLHIRRRRESNMISA